ncbi:MAG: hypothetical protein MJ228_01665 [Bacilli bacterium]|nr:hypothetical protein [Bacilli bacterium]
MRTYASFTDSPLFITIALVVFFGIIVIAVMLLKKYAKPFMSDEKPKSDKEIAEEEVNRILTDITDEAALSQMNAAIEEVSKGEIKPTEEEVLEEEMARTTEEVLDPETAKAMAQYALEHPEEAEAFEKKDE